MTSPLFDRSDLLTLLGKRVEGFRSGYRQNLALIGPAGIGKSTIVREFILREAGPGSLLLPLCLEVGPEENGPEWISRFARTVLYAVLEISKADSFPSRPSDLVEACGSLVPRTAALAKRVLSLSEAGRMDEAYDPLWELPHLLNRETGHRVLLVVEEFHRLRGLPVKEPFRPLGRKIMVQPTTLYIVTSSEPAAAHAILREGLALLFGKFESIEVPPLSAPASRKAIRSVSAGGMADPFAEYLLMDLAQGSPARLNLLLEASRKVCAEQEPLHFLLELLESLFLDPDSLLRGEFEKRLRLLPARRNRALCVQALDGVVSGLHRVPQIAAYVEKPAAQVSRALKILEEGSLTVKEGPFYRIPERLFHAWLATAYPVLQGVALMGPLQAKLHFRRTARDWIEKMKEAAERPMEDQLRELLLLWRDELVELDGKKTLLPRFRQLEQVPGPADQVSLLARPMKRLKGGWWIIPWKGSLDEAQARQMVQQMRSFGQLREYKKLLIGASPAEVNARLVLQEAKVRFWDLAVLNRLLDLYGMSRLPVPEGSELPFFQTVPLQEDPPPRVGEAASEVAG